MERIRPTGSGAFRKYGKSSKKKESSSVNGAGKPSFSEIWESETKGSVTGAERVLSHGVEADLEALVDEVHSRGESLKEKPTYENIRVYKEAVRKFLSYVIENTLEVETKEGARFNPMKKQRRYTIIKSIDEKLERLASGIMQSQVAQLEILRRVEEINGLVVDLLS